MVRMMPKMAAVALLLLCSFAIGLTDSKDECNKYAEVGQNVTVPLDYKLKGSETLKWRCNESTIFHQKGETNVIPTRPTNVVYPNGSLQLTNVQKKDTGRYTPEVHDKEGQAADGLKSIFLCILDSFPEPEVKFECSKPNRTMVTFSCNVGKANGLTFKWFKNKKELKETTQTMKQNAEEVFEALFECKASIHALSKTSIAVKHECTNPKLFGLDFWFMVGILGGGGGLVLLLIIIVIVCCIKARKKKSMKVKDEEELRLGWTNPENKRQHHDYNNPPGHHHSHQHPHHHQQQPAGHTGPRQHRHKQQRNPRSKVPDIPNGQPQPSPRRAAQTPRPVDNIDDEQPPPLPQPRKKGPKTPRVGHQERS